MTSSLPDLYWRQFEQVAARFEYHPWEENVLAERANDLDRMTSMRADRNELADQLAKYNQAIGNGEQALRHIEQLRNPSTLAVIGGQQAGLFTGPLLVIYKAATIVQEARRAQALLKRDVVPVFWIAGEDHDFNEVNHAYFLMNNRQCEKIELQHPGDERAPVSEIHFTQEDWSRALEQLDETLQPTEFKTELMQKLQEISAASSTLSDYFARMMAWLFQDSGLILLDSHDPNIRALESPFFKFLIREHKTLNDAFLQGARAVEQMGFEPQAQVQEFGVNLFKVHDGQRLLLYREDGAFQDKGGQHRWSEDELLAVAASHPEQLSNNVLTRPLMQEYLFPVLSTVLGPGEISYWAMLKEGFEAAGMKLPVIVPRIQMTLIEGTVQKQMSKFGWELHDVVNDFEAKKQAWLQEQDELQLNAKFEQVKEEFEKLYQPLLDAAASVHPGMKNLGETNKSKILEQIEFMRKRTEGAFEQQFQASIRQMDRIYLSLMPLGKPQERVYNVMMYLNRHGFDWLEELVSTSLSPKIGKYSIYF